jgi:hypothetical protein
MYTNFDYEEERQNSEDRVARFFGEFSSEVRNRLMSKNLPKPESLYDVFYPSIKKDLLSKNNNPYKVDLGEFSQKIREEQLAKAVEKTLSLEEQSEEFRKSLLARDNLHKETNEMMTLFEKKRKDLLNKNVSSPTDLMKESESYRRTNLSKNVGNLNAENERKETQENFREENLSHRVSQSQDLLDDSDDFRKENLAHGSKKEENGFNVDEFESKSSIYRNEDLAKNVQKKSDLEKDSDQFRRKNLSLNISGEETNFIEDFEQDRNDALSKNVSKDSDLEKDSAQFRDNNLSNNNSKLYKSSLEIDSQTTRRDNLSNNVANTSDLEKDSTYFRDSDLSYNVSKENDLEKDSKNYREADLSINNPIKHDLEKDSEDFRKGDLSYNKSKKTDLETISAEFRKEELSNNTSKTTDLVTDSSKYQSTNLSFNVPKETNLEEDSKETMKENLSNNVKIEHDLERESELYREEDLSNNVPNTTDLEKDSAPYYRANLANNVLGITDLEVDSIPYHNANMANNVSEISDLEKDSVPYREDDLSANASITTDLEIDSVPYREDDLSANVPSDSDLEIDSVPYREDDLSANVPIVTDLEDDSVLYREDDLSANVSSDSDLQIDSVPYREDDLSANVSSDSDLETDSVSYREDDLSANVSSDSDLQIDSVPYWNNNVSANVPNNEIIDFHSDQFGQPNSADKERQFNLSKNPPSNQSIDGHYDQYGSVNSGENERIKNLNKNVGFGQFGINVLGPGGTSVFIGVSGVWTQGLVFRNLLTMRNKYKGQANYYTEAKNLEYGEGGMLLTNTLKVPKQSEIVNQEALPMTPSEFINASVSDYQEITSPIERSLMVAQKYASAYKNFIAPYSIYDAYGTRKYEIDYNLGNQKITGKEFTFKESINEKLPDDNVNNLIRQYLKYSNPFSLDDKGKLRKENANENMGSIAAKITNLSVSSNFTQSIEDLIASYNMFNQERVSRMLNTTAKSLISPTESYFLGDVETQFDENYGQTFKSIAAKTTPGNPFDSIESGFGSSTPKKGVRKILRDISSSDIKFAGNYQNIQGVEGQRAKSFIIGYDKIDKNKTRKSYQKYTIKNPYAPGEASQLLFAITNYSIPSSTGYRTMYFPPYISSFQNSDAATWNSTNFLGRPEAIYTYSNSSRDGSISFFVLTDYAEHVVLGSYQDENMDAMSININKNFTDISQNKQTTLESLEYERSILLESLKQKKEAEKENAKSENSEIETKKGDVIIGNDGNPFKASIDEVQIRPEETAESNTYTEEEQKLINNLNKKIEEARNLSYRVNYSESNALIKNVNDFMINTEREYVDGYIESKPSDNLNRINEMIKNLAFQPGYFSGNLVDFKKKMEFIAKLTRPARNIKEESGFSFTYPPVCHLQLGGWFNHDIIINSVSYDYTDAPWTSGLDGENIQPMWANVTINFNIVGPAGESGGVPLTSTDREGFFGTSTRRV